MAMKARWVTLRRDKSPGDLPCFLPLQAYQDSVTELSSLRKPDDADLLETLPT